MAEGQSTRKFGDEHPELHSPPVWARGTSDGDSHAPLRDAATFLRHFPLFFKG